MPWALTHIKLNTKFYTHIEDSTTETIYRRHYMETHAHTHTCTHAHTHNDCSKNWVLILVGVEILWEEEVFQFGFKTWQGWAASVSDITNKTSMFGKSIKYIMSQPFSALHWYRANQHGCIQKSTDSKQKSTFAYKKTEQPNKAHKWKYLNIFYFFRPTHIFSSVPLWAC